MGKGKNGTKGKGGERMWRVQMTFKNTPIPGHDVTYVNAKTAIAAEATARKVHGKDFGGIKKVVCREVS